ncbi:MAG: hypothetical protein HYY06_23810 [Deltaproteobacteria bacterium]|nr:hypothetical protein [Deltaproteobacteria bacterium]
MEFLPDEHSVTPLAPVWAGLAIWSLSGRPVAAEPGTCLEAVTFLGDERPVATARASLEHGLLAQVPAAACAGAVLRVQEQEGRWLFALSRSERLVAHSADDAATMASWIESWLAPPLAGSGGVEATEPSPPEEPRAVGPRAPAASPRRGGFSAVASRRDATATIPIRLSLAASLDLDDLAPLWPGGEISLMMAFGPAFWLGIGAAGAWAPEQDDVERRAFRITARGGWRSPFEWGALRLGAGVGIVSASARRELDDDSMAADDEAGPFVEVGAGLDVGLSRELALTGGIALRAHLPDDLGGEGDGEEENPDELLEPQPLPAVAATLQVGVAYSSGGW